MKKPPILLRDPSHRTGSRSGSRLYWQGPGLPQTLWLIASGFWLPLHLVWPSTRAMEIALNPGDFLEARRLNLEPNEFRFCGLGYMEPVPGAKRAPPGVRPGRALVLYQFRPPAPQSTTQFLRL